MKIKYLFSIVLLFSVVFSACKKEYEPIESVDEKIIQDYLKKNSLNATKDPSGFYYAVTKQGTGELLKNTDSVLYRVAIKSAKTNATYYQSSTIGNMADLVGYTSALFLQGYGQQISVEAIRTVLLKTNRGSEASIVLPSYLAFGKNGSTALKVPENEVVVLVLTVLEEATQASRDDRVINEFLQKKGLTATKTAANFYYIVLQEGTGERVREEHIAKVKYAGRIVDGEQFDSNSEGYETSTIGGDIPGWRKMLALMRVGEKVRVFIPSALAYGGAGQGTIPPNTALDFDMEVVSVK
ncbi:hypothetical protein C7T94_06540 [Pedobacter yulinensis]|uniref:Peptidyl-prolyl cis-trans isomerase n=1 Tax=Pedobacter yulinensis TaxID=2126353 RepID=A0A2T3HPI4_9SPHI|nr:FKBP-type peptidyl-prolyl cis-trans isomerase [Pedobacter yulinensis]PST84365.1 hypothetical protein C7T94_06540 [Pedobacter yulinensis]